MNALPVLRQVAPGFLALAAGAALGWLGRYLVIEPEGLQAACAAGAAAVACAVRPLLIQLTFTGTFGITAVAAAALAWLAGGRLGTALALVALLAGGLGLFLFDADWGASGAVAALLRLARAGGRAAPQGA